MTELSPFKKKVKQALKHLKQAEYLLGLHGLAHGGEWCVIDTKKKVGMHRLLSGVNIQDIVITSPDDFLKENPKIAAYLSRRDDDIKRYEEEHLEAMESHGLYVSLKNLVKEDIKND